MTTQERRQDRATATIRNGKLIVSIGIETLAWACQPENGGDLKGDDGATAGHRVKIGHEDEWAQDVLREMNREGEATPPEFCQWIDLMCRKAYENGSGAIESRN